MRQLEKTVQILYWSFILIFFFGGISNDQEPLIPHMLTFILLGAIAAAMITCLIKYYFFSKGLK